MKRIILFAILLCTSPLWGAVARGGHSCHGETSGTNAAACSTALATAANSLIVVGCDKGDGSTDTQTAPTDGTNTYTALSAQVNNGTSMGVRMWAAFTSTGGNFTPTCHYSGTGSFNDIIAVDYTGTATSSWQEGTEVTGTASAQTVSTSGITTTTCGDVLVGYGSASSASSDTVTTSAPFSIYLAPASNDNGMADDITTGTVSGQTMTLKLAAGHTGTWAAIMVAIKPATPCGGSPTSNHPRSFIF